MGREDGWVEGRRPAPQTVGGCLSLRHPPPLLPLSSRSFVSLPHFLLHKKTKKAKTKQNNSNNKKKYNPKKTADSQSVSVR